MDHSNKCILQESQTHRYQPLEYKFDKYFTGHTQFTFFIEKKKVNFAFFFTNISLSPRAVMNTLSGTH